MDAKVVKPFKNDVQKVLEEVSENYTCDLVCGVIRDSEGWHWLIGINPENVNIIELKGYLHELLHSIDNYLYEEVE